ncbi:MAG TPA: cyclic nucleotide-binding domain-containing protein, partial [Phototrophicaceae bacterium]|nr:cyclic nucleotide-binding domain-containing protein [Phototrophicaceae bacterium]
MPDLQTDYLHRLIYFETTPPADLDLLAASLVYRTFRSEEIIFVEGDPSAGLYIIEHGRVKVFKLNPEGTEHVLHLLGDGNTFNDIAALDGGGNPANAAALSDTSLWLLPSDVLTQ